MHSKKYFTERSGFDLINDLFKKADGKYGVENMGTPADRANSSIRTLLVVWGASGFIENGGMVNLWLIDIDWRAIQEGYRRIGMPEQASLIETCIAVLRGREQPLDPNLLREIFGSEKAVRAEANKYERAFFANDKRVLSCLVKFVRDHKEDFYGLIEPK